LNAVDGDAVYVYLLFNSDKKISEALRVLGWNRIVHSNISRKKVNLTLVAAPLTPPKAPLPVVLHFDEPGMLGNPPGGHIRYVYARHEWFGEPVRDHANDRRSNALTSMLQGNRPGELQPAVTSIQTHRSDRKLVPLRNVEFYALLR
jgi:hypothetical protein